MKPIRSFVRRHPLLAYYAMAFAISWGGIVIIVGPGGFLTLTGDSPSFVLVGFAMLLGPSVAGIVMTGLVDGTEGFRDLLSRLRRWRVGGRWYAVALLTAPLVSTLIALALSLASPAFLPGILTADDKVSLGLLGLIGALSVPIFEELGWTGFAMPRFLRKQSIIATGLIMGVLWGLWHLPLFAGNASSAGSVPPLLMMAALLFAWVVPYRVLMVWLYDRTQSVLLVMVMHAPIVAGMYLLRAEAASPEQTFVTLIVTGAVYWAFVGLVALANHGQLSRREVDRAMVQAAV